MPRLFLMPEKTEYERGDVDTELETRSFQVKSKDFVAVTQYFNLLVFS